MGLKMDDIICLQCGYRGKPKIIIKGSFATELLLWILTILGGLIYSIWRISSKYRGCPQCESANIIPTTSPRAIEILREKTKRCDDAADMDELPPAKWKIVGTKDGNPITATTISGSAREARLKAEKKGILVSEIVPVE